MHNLSPFFFLQCQALSELYYVAVCVEVAFAITRKSANVVAKPHKVFWQSLHPQPVLHLRLIDCLEWTQQQPPPDLATTGTIPQCGNFMIFLSLKFYVKSILKNLEVLKLPSKSAKLNVLKWQNLYFQNSQNCFCVKFE